MAKKSQGCTQRRRQQQHLGGLILVALAVTQLTARTAHAVCPRPIVPMTLLVVSTGNQLGNGCVASFLHALLHSTSYPNQTIIVLSDTKMAEAVFREHFKHTIRMLPNFKLIIQPGKHIKSDNLNVALEHITQPIVTQFDVDDFMHPQRLDVMHRLFTDRPDLHMVLHKSRSIVENEQNCTTNYLKICYPQVEPFPRINLENLTLAATYEEIRSVWVPYMKTHEFHFCCPLLKKPIWVQNGWPTYRRSVVQHLRYSLAHERSQDSYFFSQAVKYGFNVSVIIDKLGLYNLLNNRVRGFCPRLDERFFADAGQPVCR